MEHHFNLDMIVGTFVAAGLAALLYLSFIVGGVPIHENDGLRLSALFDEIAGLKPRSPVKIGGVKVGEVVNTTLDKDFRVKVAMNLENNLQLPDDTYASVYTDGLLGDRYIELEPGGSETILKSGDTIDHTESAIVLERFIGKIMYSLGGGSSSGGGGSSTQPSKESKDAASKPAAATAP
jgi:phospholipid/cholesterol/gamma-HCH transport system substrate-binding protein